MAMLLPVDTIVELANNNDAMVMVDESHSPVWLVEPVVGVYNAELYTLRGKVEILYRKP